MTKKLLPHEEVPKPLRIHALPPGTCLNQTYQIQSVLGEGGFGITYKGIIPETGTVVAVKEYFPPSLAVRSRQEGDFTLYPYPEKNAESFDHGRARFLNEAALLRSFQDLESIVSVYGFFEENQTAYLVMEYIEGLTLRQYIHENGTLTFPEISSLLQPVIQSLARVHEKGLIHRDISPDNLIIGTDNRLHLIDFGAASRENYISPQNTVILKAGYAPPEQYAGNSKIGAWVDVYALCATIYFALTGSAPAEAIHRPDSDLPEPLSGLPQLLAWQRAVLEKGMQLRPADRFQNMPALLAALNGEPPADQNRTVIHTVLPDKGKYKKLRCRPWGLRVLAAGAIACFFLAALLFASRVFPLPAKAPAGRDMLRASSGFTALPVPSPQKPSPEPTVTASPEILTMPDLTGKNLKQAKKQLKKLDPSVKIVVAKTYHSRIPAGRVISQSIKKGVSFSRKQFSSLSLTVSRGKKTVSRAAGGKSAVTSTPAWKPTGKPASTAAPTPRKTEGNSGYHVRGDDGLSSIPLN